MSAELPNGGGRGRLSLLCILVHTIPYLHATTFVHAGSSCIVIGNN